MFERLLLAPARRAAVAMLAVAVAALWLVPTAATSQERQAPAQTLTWTAGNSITEYLSAPATATAGAATIVFENSEATGNTMGMSHTLTFDTTTPGYNHDVDINIVASPFDANGGRHEVQVNLTPGKYRYYCAIPGHGQMTGELVVTEGGGGDEDTTAPQVSAEVSGEQDADGNYVGGASVTLSATDSGSGVKTVEYAVDDAEFTTYSEPVTLDQPGEHTVHYRATDTAGNTSPVATTAFAITEPAPEDCPGSDTRETVIIDGRDTGVDNAETENGCTINDLIAEDATYPNHGAFVRHVALVTDELEASGTISGDEKGRIMSAAGRSDIGK